MHIEPVGYKLWRQAYRCTTRDAELVVVADLGPRILSLRWRGGPNLLYEDRTDFAVGAWRLYGGHRFTVAPEGKESYVADNEPCRVTRRCDSLELACDPAGSGLWRELEIAGAKEGDGFDLVHRLRNAGRQSWTGAAWAITCVPHSQIVAAADREVRYWPGTSSSVWTRGNDGAVQFPKQTRGKIGWYHPRAWLGAVHAHGSFVISVPEVPAAARFPDGGCNLEIFACPDYLELETLGPEVSLRAGASVVHEEQWRLRAPGLTPDPGAFLATRAPGGPQMSTSS